MREYRVSARVHLFNHATNDWRVNVHDVRMQGEASFQIPVLGWPLHWPDSNEHTVFDLNLFYP